MSPRLAALLEVVTKSAQQNIGVMFQATRMDDFTGDCELRQIGDTPPFPSGTPYNLYVYPAISEVAVIPGCRELQFTFVVLKPTGELLRRRDEQERTRKPGTPNQAFVEMCCDLEPHSPEMTYILDELTADLKVYWPHRRFSFMVAATSADLELCFVFADVESFKQVALDVGRRAAA